MYTIYRYKHNMHFNIETHYLHYIQEKEKYRKKRQNKIILNKKKEKE